MESQDLLKIHGALRRYCTSHVSLRSTLEVQYLLNLPCIFNTSLDSMLYLLNILLKSKILSTWSMDAALLNLPNITVETVSLYKKFLFRTYINNQRILKI